MNIALNKLKLVTLNHTKAYIQPTDTYFMEEKWDNYSKVKKLFRNFLILPIALILLSLLIIYINNHNLGSSGIHGGAYIKYPYLHFFSYFHIVLLTFLSMLMIRMYLKFLKVDKMIEASFPEKNYNLTKYLSLFWIFYGLGLFITVDLMSLGAPVHTILVSIVEYVVLFIVYILLNFLIIISNFSSEVGKIEPNFKKNPLQKFTGNLLSFFLTYALSFYLIYKIIWLILPAGVHKVGDSSVSGTIAIVLIPLSFSVFPVYSMGEKMVKGFLISKYYKELIKDGNYQKCLKKFEPKESANVNTRNKI